MNRRVPSCDNPVKPGGLAVVVGAATSGDAAARLLASLGARVRLLERNAANISSAMRVELEALGVEILTGAHTPEQFRGAALVVPSPGVPLKVLRPLMEAVGGMPVFSEMELASLFVTAPIVAVTGTSGKTTTVSLVAAMLREAGKRVFLGGNIGTPLSQYVLEGQHADVAVLEVSSFQAQGFSQFHPKVAVLLNITPNHLDHHESMEEYADAKFALFARQTPEDRAIFGPGLEGYVAAHIIRAQQEHFAITGRFRAAKLLGNHNQANIEAAFLAVSPFGVTLEQAQRAAADFEPIEHRLELVGEWEGVRYINDSKATTPSALAVALASMDRPAFLLAGGVFKGGDLVSLRPLLAEKVKRVALFGKSREVFTEAWEGAVPLDWFATLEEAMRHVRSLAAAGDAIVLAPATSSFDLYPNYIARGVDFKRIAAMLR